MMCVLLCVWEHIEWDRVFSSAVHLLRGDAVCWKTLVT